jgi:16S rRNA C1402 N4-methylase RsmH
MRQVELAKEAISQILGEGECALDITVGNGNDTLFLSQCVGQKGLVVAFDLQQEAIEKSRMLLSENNITPTLFDSGNAPALLPETGVLLIKGDHSEWDNFSSLRPKAVMANLGYLPGGDKEITTREVSTVKALKRAISRLQKGGRMSILCYVGHPGGKEEAKAVSTLFKSLSPNKWKIREEIVKDTFGAPILIVADKIE